jgi:hypothetical protein
MLELPTTTLREDELLKKFQGAEQHTWVVVVR